MTRTRVARKTERARMVIIRRYRSPQPDLSHVAQALATPHFEPAPPELVRALSLPTMFRPTRLSPILRQAAVPRACRGLANATPQLPLESHGNLPSSQSPITPKMHFFNSVVEAGKQIPTYRVIDGTGRPIEGAEVPEVRCVSSR